MLNRIRCVVAIILSGAIAGSLIRGGYREVYQHPDFYMPGFVLSSIVGCACTFLMFYGLLGGSKDRAEVGIFFGGLGLLFIDMLAVPWIHGSFMRVPTYALLVGFFCVMLEIGDADVTEVTIRKARD